MTNIFYSHYCTTLNDHNNDYNDDNHNHNGAWDVSASWASGKFFFVLLFLFY